MNTKTNLTTQQESNKTFASTLIIFVVLLFNTVITASISPDGIYTTISVYCFMAYAGTLLSLFFIGFLIDGIKYIKNR